MGDPIRLHSFISGASVDPNANRNRANMRQLLRNDPESILKDSLLIGRVNSLRCALLDKRVLSSSLQILPHRLKALAGKSAETQNKNKKARKH